MIPSDIPLFWRDANLPYVEIRAAKDSSVCYEKHSHSTFSIGSVVGGQSYYLNKHYRQEISTGSLVIINPEDMHACNPRNDGKWSYNMIYLNTDWLSALQHEMGSNKNDDFQMFSIIASNDKDLFQSHNQLISILTQEEDLLAKESALVDYCMSFQTRLTTSSEIQLKENKNLLIAADFIESNSLNKISLMDICAVSQLSRAYLIRAFQKRFGITPHAYQLNHRINKAKQFLKFSVGQLFQSAKTSHQLQRACMGTSLTLPC